MRLQPDEVEAEGSVRTLPSDRKIGHEALLGSTVATPHLHDNEDRLRV